MPRATAEGRQAYTKCQVEYYLVRVKVFGVVTIVREKGKVCGRYTPTGIQEKRSSSRPVLAYLRRYVGAVVSWPEIDPNAEYSRSNHHIVPTAIHIERRAVGGATFVEVDTTSFVAVDRRVTVGGEGSSIIGCSNGRLRIRAYTQNRDLPRLRLAQCIGRHLTIRGSMQSGLIYVVQIDACREGERVENACVGKS